MSQKIDLGNVTAGQKVLVGFYENDTSRYEEMTVVQTTGRFVKLKNLNDCGATWVPGHFIVAHLDETQADEKPAAGSSGFGI